MNKGIRRSGKVTTSRFLVQAMTKGCMVTLNEPGNSIDAVMKRIRKNKLRSVRECKMFLFYNRSTGKLVTMRFN
jgi:thymidylate kinase